MKNNYEKTANMEKDKNGNSTLDISIRIIIAVAMIAGLIYVGSYGYFRYENPKFKLTNGINFSNNGDYLCASTYDGAFIWHYDNEKMVLRKKLVIDPERGVSTGDISPNGRYYACGDRTTDNIPVKFIIYDSRVDRNIIEDNERTLTVTFTPDNDVIGGFYKYYSTRNGNDFVIHYQWPNTDSVKKEETQSLILKKTFKDCLRCDVSSNKIVLYKFDYSAKLMSAYREIKIPYKYSLSSDYPENNIRSGGYNVFIFDPAKVIITDITTGKSTKYDIDVIVDRSRNMPYCASNNGEWFALVRPSGKYGTIEVYETKTGKKLWDKEVDRKEPVVYMALSKKTNLLAVGYQRNHRGRKGRIEVYNIKTGQTIVPIMK